MPSKHKASTHKVKESDVLSRKALIAKFEIMMYALPDEFMVYVEESGKKIEDAYLVTRSRRAYESSSDHDRYKYLISPTEMRNIVKRHLHFEKQQLNYAHSSESDVNVHYSKLLATVEELRDPLSRRNAMFRLQPRWTRRTDSLDELYEEALSLVVRTQIADVTLVRDNLSIGQSQAEMIMKHLEDNGIISKGDGIHKRTILIDEDGIKRDSI